MAVFEPSKVSQSNIDAEVVVGRDSYDQRTINNYHQTPVVFREDKRLKALIEGHEREIKLDPDYKELSLQLNNFLYRKALGISRDLEQKLIDGGRDHDIFLAMELKEKVMKKLLHTCNFESAQKIYTHLLTEIRIAFRKLVTSRIKSGEFSTYQIDDLVHDRIIDPLLVCVEECSLEIDREELYGLLYILTGNCYIEWD